jgi:hypothetical protein
MQEDLNVRLFETLQIDYHNVYPTSQMVKQAFKTKSKILHPDKGGSNEQVKVFYLVFRHFLQYTTLKLLVDNFVLEEEEKTRKEKNDETLRVVASMKSKLRFPFIR